MKTLTTPTEGITAERLLEQAAGQDVVFLTQAGEVRFALMPADEGDREICALKNNGEFMAYLTECKERAQRQPRTSLQQIRELYSISPVAPPDSEGEE